MTSPTRRRSWAGIGVAAAAVPLAAAGKTLEPGSPAALVVGGLVLLFWIAAAARVGRAVAGIGTDTPGGSHGRLRVFLYSYLYILCSVALLGALHLLDAVVLTMVNALAFLVPGPARAPEDDRPSPSRLVALVKEYPIVTALVIVVTVVTLINAAWAVLAPIGHRDDLTYHLVFPVEWSQTGTLNLKEVPFGNHSPTYHPKNTELVFTWMFLPLRQVYPIVALQLVLLAVTVLAVYDTLRLCGARVHAAVPPAVLVCVSPVAVKLMTSCYVDIAFALFFILTVNAVLALREGPSRAGWVDLWAAAGIFVGSKMLGGLLAVAVLVPLAVVLLTSHRRATRDSDRARRLGAVLIGPVVFVAAGGWWYLRNLFETGNPFFPAIVEVFGVTIFGGAYGSEAFASSEPATVLELYLPGVGLLILAGAVWTLGLCAVRGLRPVPDVRAGLLVIVGVGLPLALAATFWLLVPIGAARFVLALYALSTATLVLPLSSTRPVRVMTEALALSAVLVGLVFGSERGGLLLPVSYDRLRADGFVWGAVALTCAALAVAGLATWVRLSAHWRRALGVTAVAASLATLLVASRTSDPSGELASEAVTRRFGPYRFVDEHYGPVRIAVTGTNESLGVFGRRFANRVGYVNINDTGDDLFHDHVLRRPGPTEVSRTDLGGVRFYRSDPSYEAWLGNLRAFGADLLLVSRLPPWARKQPYLQDDDGFPLEAGWAEDHPDRFRRVYTSDRIRIYEVVRAGSP